MPRETLDSVEVAAAAAALLASPDRPASIIGALAARFRCCERTIGRLLRAEEINIAAPRVDKPSEGYLRAMYVGDGLTAAQIADRYGVSTRTVERWLSAAEVRRG